MPKAAPVSDLDTRRSARAERPRTHATTCTACGGIDDAHDYGCANYTCPECRMMSGNHTGKCSVPAARRAETLSGTTGGPLATGSDPAEAEPDDADDPDDEEGGAEEVDEPEPDEKAQDDDDLPRVKAPAITAADVRTLQEALESRKLVGVKQPLSKSILCGETHIAHDEEVGCCEVAVVAIVDESSCGECGKMRSKRLLALCVAHGARYAAGEAVDPQMQFVLEVA